MGKYVKKNGNGTASLSDLATGTPDISKFVRGDGSWATPSGGGGAHAVTHQNGGGDQLSVAGLSGVLADPQTPIIGSSGTQAVAGNDSRLTDARTPLAHSHPQSDITNLTTDLAGKALLSHTHSLSDITDEGALALKNSIATGDIDAEAVTFPKIQNIATNKLLGRGSASAGDIEEITLGTNLTLAGTTLNASGGGGGGLTLTTVEVNLASAPKVLKSGSFQITGLVGLTPNKPVLIRQACGPYTGKGALADEAEMDFVSVIGKVLDATTIQCYWHSDFPVQGNFKFDYQVSA